MCRFAGEATKAEVRQALVRAVGEGQVFESWADSVLAAKKAPSKKLGMS